MTPQLFPHNWYWLVGAQVYSTLQRAYVSLPDKAYSAWLELGNVAGPVADEVALFDYLARVYPEGLPLEVKAARDKRAALEAKVISTFIDSAIAQKPDPQADAVAAVAADVVK